MFTSIRFKMSTVLEIHPGGLVREIGKEQGWGGDGCHGCVCEIACPRLARLVASALAAISNPVCLLVAEAEEGAAGGDSGFWARPLAFWRPNSRVGIICRDGMMRPPIQIGRSVDLEAREAREAPITKPTESINTKPCSFGLFAKNICLSFCLAFNPS
jgi:hypothetical protein